MSGAARPNVLFVCADDLNGWIGALGRHPGARTPHIDALAARGTLFRHAYCTAPHCNPSRTSVFTGLRPTTTGVYHAEQLRSAGAPAPATLPEWLRAAGYRAFGAGKVFHGHYDYATAARTLATRATWHDTHNALDLWDEFHVQADEPLPPGRPLNGMTFPEDDGQALHWYAHFDWGVYPSGAATPGGPAESGAAPPGERLPDDLVCDHAEAFLRRDHDRPFFCAVGLYRPHLPWYVPAPFFALHPLESVHLPPVREDDLEDVPAIAREWAETPPDHARILRHGQWRRAVQGYLAAVSYCDALVGRLVRVLEETDRWRDTVVVLFGDNGFHLGEKLHWRKFTLWEEATRVPLVIRAPGAPEGHVHEPPVSLLDLFPTLARLCGVEPPAGLEGESLADAVAGGRPARRLWPIASWGRGNHSVRSPRWRYTRYRDGSEELYDHDSDPYEWTNLAGRSEHAAVRARLAPALDALVERERSRA